MDKIKKTRTAVRAAYTRTLTTLSQLLEEESVDIVELRSRFAILKDKTCELEELDQQTLHSMQDTVETSENDMIKEIEQADEYRIKYQRMKVRVNNVLDPPPQARQQQAYETRETAHESTYTR